MKGRYIPARRENLETARHENLKTVGYAMGASHPPREHFNRCSHVVPLPKECLDRIGLQDRLLFQQANHLRIVALFELRLQALPLSTRVFQREQRVRAKVKPLRAAIVSISQLKRDLAERRDAHAEPIAVTELL